MTLNTPKWCWLLVYWHQTRFLEEGKQSVEEGCLCLPPSVHHQLYIHSQTSSSLFTSLLPLGPLRQVVLLPLCDATFYVSFDQSHHLSFKAAAGSFKEREVPLQILQLAAVFWWPQAHVTTHNCLCIFHSGGECERPLAGSVPEPLGNTLFSRNQVQVLNEWLHSS